ncbi:MAG: hypothetical protein DRJ61_07160 [Acidobacteria bacterium]|nr:MAG: hypothetical protein DRJ61_07160 [Acidobacteriota bacterium]
MAENTTDHKFEVLKILQRDTIKSREIGPGSGGAEEGMANRLSVKCLKCGDTFTARRTRPRIKMRPGCYRDDIPGSTEIEISCKICGTIGSAFFAGQVGPDEEDTAANH